MRRNFPKAQIIAGNVATAEAALALAKAGADAVKVGIGPGSICTTRVVAGVGVPQITAITDCATRAGDDATSPSSPTAASSTRATSPRRIAAGAHTVMIGSLFAGTDEAPGEIILYQGRSYKVYRGMGSIGAMRAGSRDRYFQARGRPATPSWCPRASRGACRTAGRCRSRSTSWSAASRPAWATRGCRTIDELRTKARFVRATAMGLRESHVHDVIITKEAPNYRVEQ